MPTYHVFPQFWKMYHSLSVEQKAQFRTAVNHMVEDIKNGQGFRSGLRVKGVKGRDGIYEMTWANDGRATFSYGSSIVEGTPHIQWHQVGTHEIF